MKQNLSILFWLFPFFVHAQNDSLGKPGNAAFEKETEGITGVQHPKPEILSGGFIDFAQNGQMNASARLFRLYIGEPGKFQIPVSVYTGVSANNFSVNRQPEDVILHLINPGTGIFNVSFDGINPFIGKKSKITRLQLQYQGGFRFLSVYNKQLYENISFFNVIGAAGFTFVTGAWERAKVNNIGLFWLNFRGLFSGNPPEIFGDFFPVTVTHNLLAYSAGMGVEITQTLNVKVFYFHFLNNRDVPAFTKPFLQITFNYSLR